MNDLHGKRGQVAIFVIIAVLIVIAAILFFVLREPAVEEEVPFDADEIYSFVDSCVQESSEDALYIWGMMGGYYDNPPSMNQEGAPYYYLDGENLMPSKEKLEEEFSKFVVSFFETCTEEMENFVDADLSRGELNVETNIREDSLKISVNKPLTVSRNDVVLNIEENYEESIFINFERVYESISELVEENLELEVGEICLSCMSDIEERENLDFLAIQDDDGTNVFIVSDPTFELNEEFIFIFAGV